MTSMTSSTAPDVLAPALSTDDSRHRLARAVALGGSVIGNLRPEQLDGPTPCTHFDVRQVAGHLVAVLQRVAFVGAGRNPFDAPELVTGVPDDGWATAWTAAAHDLQRVWSDPELLDH